MLIYRWSDDCVQAESVRHILDYIRSSLRVEDKGILRSVYSALTELLYNIREHAYPEVTDNSYCPWSVTLTRVGDGRLSIVVEDNGISIPVSILQKVFNHRASLSNANCDDSMLITQAVNYTSTNNSSGRGKGLKSILRLIDADSLEALCISSRNGVFCYPSEASLSSYAGNNSVNGTVVEIIISEGAV
ncbi:TPA: ATP-binding protein [Vibrio diabolicus]